MENKELNNLKEIQFDSYEELYKTITKEGSLGLLALGARGLQLWRKKREELSKGNVNIDSKENEEK